MLSTDFDRAKHALFLNKSTPQQLDSLQKSCTDAWDTLSFKSDQAHMYKYDIPSSSIEKVNQSTDYWNTYKYRDQSQKLANERLQDLAFFLVFTQAVQIHPDPNPHLYRFPRVILESSSSLEEKLAPFYKRLSTLTPFKTLFPEVVKQVVAELMKA